MSNKDVVKCAICGVNEATTMDHIPPKNIFIPPRPQNMITVPSCASCNNGASGADESFKAYLTTHIQSINELYGNNDIPDMLNKLLMPTLNNNRKLTKRMNNSAKPVSIRTSSGIYIGKEWAIKFPQESLDVLKRIVRGLYYKHTGHVLGLDISCKVIMENNLDRWKSIIAPTPRHSVGSNDEFIYRYRLYDENPKISFWFLFFYKSCMFVTSTGDDLIKHS